MKKILFSTLTLFTVLAPLSASALTVRPNFNPSILIPDASFNDTHTFGGPEGIQRFLESMGSVLANTSPDFLAKLAEPADPAVKLKLNDPEPNLGRLRTAAELIWDVSQESGINPQVTLVTLHKEQGLIGPVDPNRLSRALTHAMGFDCPDSSGCGNLFPGFYYQLFGNIDTEGNRYLGAARSLMKSFNTPGGRGPLLAGAPAKVGQQVTLGNTMGDYDGIAQQQDVVIGNSATAALYRYTPHVFNGNYNFWKFFTTWFKYPNGTLLRSTVDGTVYIISDGELRRIPAFVAAARGISTGSAIGASPVEISTYPMGRLYGPTDNTVISLDGQFYVFIDGIRHPASSFVLTQRKLDPAQILPISPSDARLFDVGSQLTPSDGTVLKAVGSPDVFLVSNGILRKFSEFTFKQYGAAPKMQIIADSEVGTYPKDGYVPPMNGTLIKSRLSDTAYLMSDGRRLPLTPELFANHRFSAKNVVTLTTDEEIASIPVGPVATPAEDTYFLMGKEFFLFKNGVKHPIFAFVAKQRGMTPDYKFEESIAGNWPDGIAIAPKDETLLRGQTDPTVYVIKKGQRRPVTSDIFKLLKYSFKNVITVPDNEIDALAKDGYAEPPENTYFSVKGSKEFYVFMSGTKRKIVPLVAQQRKMTPDYVFEDAVVDDWTMGIAVAPKDGTLLQSDAGGPVYLVSSKLLRPLTDAAFKRRGYSAKNVNKLPSADIELFAKGDQIK